MRVVFYFVFFNAQNSPACEHWQGRGFGPASKKFGDHCAKLLFWAFLFFVPVLSWLRKRVCWCQSAPFVSPFADNTWNSRHCVEHLEFKSKNMTNTARNLSEINVHGSNSSVSTPEMEFWRFVLYWKCCSISVAFYWCDGHVSPFYLYHLVTYSYAPIYHISSPMLWLLVLFSPKQHSSLLTGLKDHTVSKIGEIWW